MKYKQRSPDETLGILYKLIQDKRFTKITITQVEDIRTWRYDIETDEP